MNSTIKPHTVSSKDPLVSVVTPVHNGEKYLSQCVESILKQAYENWEYIIVDNKSTDRTSEIAESFASKDDRIHLITNDTLLPMIENWNHSLGQISSDSVYCKVVHADDWLYPECLEQMVRVGEEYPTVGIVGAYRLQGSYVTLDGLPHGNNSVSGREICRQVLLRKLHIFGSPTSTMIRSELIRQKESFYNESNLHADAEACFELLRKSDFGFVHQVLTFTRKHEESVGSAHIGLDTQQLSRYYLINKYGSTFLSDEEYGLRLKLVKRDYFQFTAKCAMRWIRNRDAWTYHRQGLRSLGLNPSMLKMIKMVPYVFIESLFNPRKIAREITRVAAARKV